MQKQHRSDMGLLRKSAENLAQVLDNPAVADLKNIADDPDLLASEERYWGTVKELVEASNDHSDRAIQSQGSVRTFLNQSSRTLPNLSSGVYGPGQDILASDAHTSALDALRTAFRNHASRERETRDKARQAGASDLVRFPVNRALLADWIRLAKPVNEQLIWSSEQPWAP
jgi:hypothetical protein